MAEVYFHNSFNNDEYKEYIENLKVVEDDDSSSSFDSNKTTPQYHIQKADMAMHNLKFVVNEPGWKRALQHKSGVTIFSKPGITRDDQIPVFMGEHVIEGFTPRAIFAVIGMRTLWDDWYEEGSLIENLNDTTSLTYMVMQALAGSKTRDLSLVEKIDCAQDGKIYFAATSVETPKVPRVYNRIRAHLNLNGWILEPLTYNPPRTKVTYVLQTKIKGWVPSILSKTYLARRPLVLHTIDQYLQKNGALPMVVSTPPESNHPSRAQSDTSSTNQDNNNTQSFEVKYPRRKISFSNFNNVTPDSPEEIQDGILPHQDEPTSSSSPSRTTSPVQPLSPVISPAQPLSHVQPPSRPPPHVQPPFHVQPPSQPPSHVQPPSHDQSLSQTILTEESVSSQSSVESVKPVQHRHTASLEKALEVFRSHVPSHDWNFHSEDKGIKIYMKDSGRSTPIMRGEGVISGGFTTYDVLSVIENLKLWDDGLDDATTFEIFSLHEQLTKASMKGIFPISGRDFSSCGTLRCEEDGTLQFVATSVVDPLIPEARKYVRGKLNFAGWQLKPHFDVDGDTTKVDVVYIADIDIKLDIIPSSIRKMLSVQIPTNVAKVNGYMQKNGFSPYILNTTVKIEKDFNDKKDHYELSLFAEGGGVTEFKLSKMMFPNGFEVSTIPEDCKVELLLNSTKIIRVTFPQRIDVDIVTITVSKNSKGFRMTYNHGQTIPTISDIENPFEIIKKRVPAKPKHLSHSTNVTTSTNTSAKPKHLSHSTNVTTSTNTSAQPKHLSYVANVTTSKNISEHFSQGTNVTTSTNILAQSKHINHSTNVTTSTNVTLVANETVDGRVISSESGSDKKNKRSSRKTRKSATNSRNIITSKLFSPAEVPLKSDPHQRLLEKQTLLENKIAAVTRASRREAPLLEVKPKTEEYQTSNNGLFLSDVQEEFQVSNDDLTPFEVKQYDQKSNDPFEAKQPITDYQKLNNYLTPLKVKPKDDLSPLEEVKPKIDQPYDNLSPLEKNRLSKVTKDNSIALSNFTNMDSIRFNAQQIGIIFASMLLAYYAGKLSI